MGRLPNEKVSGSAGQIVNAPSIIQDREDAVAALELLAERRREMERKKAIETTAVEVGSA